MGNGKLASLGSRCPVAIKKAYYSLLKIELFVFLYQINKAYQTNNMKKRFHKCQLCGQMVPDTSEARREHFQRVHAEPRKCICQVCGTEILDTIEERQKHTRIHLENNDELISPLYVEKESKSPKSEIYFRKKGRTKGIRGGKPVDAFKYRKYKGGPARITYNSIESNRRKH